MREGIIFLKLIDPFSKFISHYLGLEDSNTIGYYFHNEENICYVYLFNIFSANVIYLNNGIFTLENIMSIAVDIILYPINFDKNISYPILHKKDLLKNNSFNNIDRNVFLHLINEDIKKFSPLDYNFLFQEKENKDGYSIINSLLYKLKNKPDKIKCHKLSHHSIFKSPIQLKSNHSRCDQDIIDKSKIEINKFLAVMIEKDDIDNLFTKNRLLYSRDKVLELINKINNSLEKGYINKQELIDDINEVNKKLKIFIEIPDIKHEKIDVINYSYSFVNNEIYVEKIISKISNYLKSLVQLFDSQEDIPLINLSYIINNFNKFLLLKKYPENYMIIYDNTKEKIKHFIVENEYQKIQISDTIIITVSEPNLDKLTKEQLLECLVYIDSLRSDDNIQDKKYCVLQNKIIEHLQKIK
jgi:hypothetical protein